MVIFRPVRITNRKKRAEIMIKDKLIIKGEKSKISIGEIKATVPKTRVAGTITAPIKSPKTIQVSPCFAAKTAK